MRARTLSIPSTTAHNTYDMTTFTNEEAAHRDLASPPSLIAYLASTPFASTRVEELTGGNANYVFRLFLEKPYKGRATLVVKHAKAVLKGSTDFRFWVDRQGIEVEAYRRVREVVGGDRATVPEVHFYDEEEHVMVMDDAGAGAGTLKALLITAPPSLEVVSAMGTGLGTFLGKLHRWGKDNEEALDAFSKNVEGRVVSAGVTFGRLVRTLTTDPIPSLTNPRLEITEAELAKVAQAEKDGQVMTEQGRETVVHGDFWPGNVIVNVGEDEWTAYVVDWEVCAPGVGALDVGQFTAELETLAAFYPARKPVVDALKSAFDEAYEKQVGGLWDKQRRERIARQRAGAHKVGWTPRVPWGKRAMTRAVVQQGIHDIVSSTL